MKKRIPVSILAMLILLLSEAPLVAEDFVYGLVPDSPPTTFVDENGQPTGFLVELYSRIMDELDIPYRYEVAPFAELYPEMVSGEIDLFTALMKTPEREELFHYPDLPAISGWGQLFVSESTNYEGIQSLAGRDIGSIKDDINGDNFYDFARNMGIVYSPVEFENFEDLIEAVRSGGVYAGVVSNVTLVKAKGVSPTSTVFSPLPGYAVTAKGSEFTDELEAISVRLAELKGDKDSYYYLLLDEWFNNSSQANLRLAREMSYVVIFLLVILFAAHVFNRILKSQVKQRTKQLEYQLRHDSLTGLPNRQYFLEELKKLCSRQDGKYSAAVMIVGLDHFKEYNDAHDNRAGDLLLKSFAERITRFSREELFCGRLGGDEFFLLCRSTGGGCDPMEIYDDLKKVMSLPLEVEGYTDHDAVLTGGCSLFPGDSGDPEELYRCASIALHHGKKGQRGHMVPYKDWMDLTAKTRQHYKTELRSCLERDEILIYYQPKLDLKHMAITGVEALVRWEKEGTLIPPDDFIPLAEETGVIIPLGEYIIRKACRDISALNDSMDKPISVAVNLSSLQFTDGALLETIKAGLEESRMERGLLECEITESIAIGNLEKALEVLGELRKAGIPVAMDDFGTGYSSLAYLKDLPLDILKIDKAFMDHMLRNPDKRGIVQLILEMARELNLKTVAEGVEDWKQLDFLMQRDCRQIQGYILSPPRDILSLRDFLSEFDYGAWIDSLER